MATFTRKCFWTNKYFKFLTTQNIRILIKTPTISMVEKEKGLENYNFRGSYSFLYFFGRRTKSYRGNWWCKFPHVLLVFGALYICSSDAAECMDNEESLSSIPKTGIAESPQKNRHNKRNSNGCFPKLRKVRHKEKSLHPMKRFSCKKKA